MGWFIDKLLGRSVAAPESPLPASGPYAEFSRDDFDKLALRMVTENQPSVFDSGKKQMAHMAALRERFEKIEPKQLRCALPKWLDYYEGLARERCKEDIAEERMERLRATVVSQGMKKP